MPRRFFGPRSHVRAERERLSALRFDRIGINPMAATCGAEVTGVDLGDIDDATFAEIERAFLSRDPRPEVRAYSNVEFDAEPDEDSASASRGVLDRPWLLFVDTEGVLRAVNAGYALPEREGDESSAWDPALRQWLSPDNFDDTGSQRRRLQDLRVDMVIPVIPGSSKSASESAA